MTINFVSTIFYGTLMWHWNESFSIQKKTFDREIFVVSNARNRLQPNSMGRELCQLMETKLLMWVTLSLNISKRSINECFTVNLTLLIYLKETIIISFRNRLRQFISKIHNFDLSNNFLESKRSLISGLDISFRKIWKYQGHQRSFGGHSWLLETIFFSTSFLVFWRWNVCSLYHETL